MSPSHHCRNSSRVEFKTVPVSRSEKEQLGSKTAIQLLHLDQLLPLEQSSHRQTMQGHSLCRAGSHPYHISCYSGMSSPVMLSWLLLCNISIAIFPRCRFYLGICLARVETQISRLDVTFELEPNSSLDPNQAQHL